MTGHPPDLVEAVVKEYGRKRAQDVAAEYGLPSRSSVIALWYRARRSGLIDKKTAVAKTVDRSDKQNRKSLMSAPARKHDPEPEPRVALPIDGDPQSRGCNIMGLHYLSCRWIVRGSGVSAIYCGERKSKGAYCTAHAKLAYVPIRLIQSKRAR